MGAHAISLLGGAALRVSVVLAIAAATHAGGGRGEEGLALFASKALIASREGAQVLDDAVVLVKDGRIEAVGPRRGTQVPEGYQRLDVGSRWVMPGMIDLHTHVGGSGRDINDMVYQTNEGLRVSPAVEPRNPMLLREVAAGITTVLFIPGSGTNIGGAGILMKTGLDTFEEMRIRDPGSLKIAQADNPARWGYGMGRITLNYHIRGTVRRGLAYARAWREHEAGRGPRPAKNVQYEVFRDLLEKRTQVSTHTQVYQVVLATITILRGEFGLDVYIDHGEWKGFLAAELAREMQVDAIIGPRQIDTFQGRIDTDGRILGVAAGYQERGLERVGFNTDAPVVPGEELPLQSAVGVRYGFDNSRMQAVRALTIVPAMTAGIADRVGSLEAGKDADIAVVTGDPSDPRSAVDLVFIEGRKVYEVGDGPRRW
jgi:imidazolonepropionase-like amidohydrolase